MPTFTSYDGALLSYQLVGTGPMLLCHPGGPGCAADYLGDLGGLAAHRTLVRLDPRGVGSSAVPADPAAYRMDRLAEDVRALADHLGLDRFDLLGHSAGGNVGVLVAAAYPERLAHLVLCCGGGRIAGLKPVGADEADQARSGEPWYADATAAARELWSDDVEPDEARIAELRARIAPFYYGRWDDAARAHSAATEATRRPAAAEGFYAGFAPDIESLHAALAGCGAPVLSMAGSLDGMPTPAVAATLAALFPRGSAVTIEGGGHYPWLDSPAEFAGAVESFLAVP